MSIGLQSLHAAHAVRDHEKAVIVLAPVGRVEHFKQIQRSADSPSAEADLLRSRGACSEISANRRGCVVPCTHRDGMSVLDLVGGDHEIVVKLRRALSYRYPVNRIAV
jgi:hypothetical protein